MVISQGHLRKCSFNRVVSAVINRGSSVMDTGPAGEKSKTYTASDLEEKEEASTILNTITSIISKETVEGEKGELVLKAVFDMGGDTLELKVYKVDEQNCIATFCGEDRFVDMEKIQKIIELIV